jgi:lipopolysaccharide transport system ATP-binding protein
VSANLGKWKRVSWTSFDHGNIVMSDKVISVDNLSKRYLVGHQSTQRERYTLRDAITWEARNFARKTADFLRGRQIVQGDEVEEFWALKDVSFEVRHGEVLGIIGRNGAGKSTLLKILSRITEPSHGQIRIKGRVASLLEVGTGFHPELTGRENIFLNGAILGMTQREIRNKFDAIVAFAEVEKFLDTAVKYYSSGMYVRLAFAVAAHLEPEILIVDEVLAVGDSDFQKKCLGKMGEVARHGGRTVLFVSHNMAAIQALCHRAILLQQGELLFAGNVESCAREYEKAKHHVQSAEWNRPADIAVASFGFTRIAVQLGGRQPALVLQITCTFAGQPTHRPVMLAFDISNAHGTPLMQALPSVEPFLQAGAPERKFRFEIKLPPVVPGEYWLTAWAGPQYAETFDFCSECVSFEVHDSPTPGRAFPHHPDNGFLVPACSYKELYE